MTTTGLTLPGSSGMDVVERLACGIRPDPRAGCSRIVTVGAGPVGDLTMRNRSMSRHAALYAVVVLCLSIAITPLLLVALLLF
jgi:hypothetical protein